jgi:hypothetical protein
MQSKGLEGGRHLRGMLLDRMYACWLQAKARTRQARTPAIGSESNTRNNRIRKHNSSARESQRARNTYEDVKVMFGGGGEPTITEPGSRLVAYHFAFVSVWVGALTVIGSSQAEPEQTIMAK